MKRSDFRPSNLALSIRAGFPPDSLSEATLGTWTKSFCKVNGALVYLWRAVDHSGQVLDILVQRKVQEHETHAAVLVDVQLGMRSVSGRSARIVGIELSRADAAAVRRMEPNN